MKKIFLLTSFAVILLAVACSPSKEKQQAKISNYENELFSSGMAFDETKAKELIKLLEDFAADFPKDSLTPVYLNKAADVYVSLNQPEKAVATFDKIISQYPEYKHVSICCFMKGFVYDAAGNTDKARVFYNEFIQKYPNHVLVNDAKMSIENLGLTPDELIQKLENQNNSMDSTQSDTVKQ